MSLCNRRSYTVVRSIATALRSMTSQGAPLTISTTCLLLTSFAFIGLIKWIGVERLDQTSATCNKKHSELKIHLEQQFNGTKFKWMNVGFTVT